MNKRLTISIITIIFTLTAITTLFIIGASGKQAEPNTASGLQSYFVLKEYNHKIAIFKDGSDSPLEELDVNYDSLPEADKTLLKNGIYANTYNEIISKAEDYDG